MAASPTLIDENNLRILSCASFLRENVKGKPLDDDTDFLCDVTYLRYARARNGDNKKALTMLEATVAWRREYMPHRLTKDALAHHYVNQTMWQVGRDKKGNALVYGRPGTSNPFPADERVRYLVFMLEQAVRSGSEKMTWIIDWSLWGQRKNDAESSEARKRIIQVLQDHYPERLAAMYMVGQPWFITMLYYVSAPFIDSTTRAKVHISYTKEKLLDVVDRAQLIDFLGGNVVSSTVAVDSATSPSTSAATAADEVEAERYVDPASPDS